MRDQVHGYQMWSHFVGGYWLDFSQTEHETKIAILWDFEYNEFENIFSEFYHSRTCNTGVIEFWENIFKFIIFKNCYRFQFCTWSSYFSFLNWHHSAVKTITLNNMCEVFVFRILSWHLSSIDPFPIRRATSVPLGKGKKFALHHGKMSTTKRRAIQILHISTFQFTFKCGYNYFISKYTDVNSLHVTQINLLHNNNICCST